MGGRDGRPGTDWSVWTRVAGAGRPALDLLHASLVRWHYAPHMHAEFAIGACTVGREVIRYRGASHYAGPGTLLVIEPGEPHTGGPAEPDGFVYRALYPPAELLAEPGRPAPHFRELVIHDPELAGGLRSVHAALSRPGDPLERESRLVGLLGQLVLRYAETPADGLPRRRLVEVARPVMSRLADQMAAPPSLAEVAAELGLSRYQLVRAFHDEVGMPPYAWLAQHRVTHAKALLDRGGQLAEVAARLGFADQAHLTRWFRRVVGVTPGVYRNSVQDAGREWT